VELSHGNFDHSQLAAGGRRPEAEACAARWAPSGRDIELSFVEPWFLDRKLSLGVDLYHRDRRFLSDEYDQAQHRRLRSRWASR
jgi:outer membrane protein insertion porin family